MSSIPPPPPPPPPPGGPYGQPSPGYGYQTGYDPNQGAYSALEGRSTTVLVLGILSLVLCGLLGPVAWSMGNKIKQEAAAMGRDEPGSCKGGRICGIIATALIVLGVVGFVLIAVIGVANSSNSG